MKTITKICLCCNKEFEASLKEHTRGNAKYCSLSCSSKYAKSLVVVENNVSCALCQKLFYLSSSKQKKSKSGLFFCCRAHKDAAQRIGGIEVIQPDHYNHGKHNYRSIAFRSLDHKCEKCGYDEYPQILQVHHKDKNRENNLIENLQILCPTCHEVFHFLDNSGRWV